MYKSRRVDHAFCLGPGFHAPLMSIPVPPVDFSRRNAGDQFLHSDPPSFPQAWDSHMFQQEWPQYQSHSSHRAQSQSQPESQQHYQQCNVQYTDAPHSTANAFSPEAPRHCNLPSSQSSQYFVQAPQPSPQDEPMLSPLPIDQLPHNFPYQDVITPPTPDFPNSALHSPASTTFFTPLSSIAELSETWSPPKHHSNLRVSPAVSTHSIPHSPYGSPYASLPSPMSSTATTYSSPFPYTPNHLPTNVYSPMVASPSSFYSMTLGDTPAMRPLPSLPPVHNPPSSSTAEPTMSPKRPTAPSLTRVRVPQPLELVSTHNATFAVAFKVHRKAGVSVRDVLSGKATVDGHNERVFEQTGVRQFRLVIDWPGYDQAGAYVSVREDGAFITRGELAKRVCKSIQKFMQKKAKKKSNSSNPGEGDEWTIARDRGQRGITIDKLWLVRVLPTARNMWMAELEVQM